MLQTEEKLNFDGCRKIEVRAKRGTREEEAPLDLPIMPIKEIRQARELPAHVLVGCIADSHCPYASSHFARGARVCAVVRGEPLVYVCLNNTHVDTIIRANTGRVSGM